MQTGALFFGAAGQAANPGTIPGLRVWYDAINPLGTGILPLDGTALSIWYDLSGNGFNTTGGTPGIFEDNTINGLPAIVFDGTTMYYTFPSASTIGLTSSDYTIFMIVSTANPATQFLIAGAPNECFEMHLNDTQGLRFIPVASTYLDLGINGQFADNRQHLFQAMVNGNTPLASVDADNISPITLASNCQNNATAGMSLGLRSDMNYYFNGYMGEVVIYNRALTSQELTNIRNYFALKWAVTV